MIHGPSLGIGAAVATVAVIVAFTVSTGMVMQEGADVAVQEDADMTVPEGRDIPEAQERAAPSDDVVPIALLVEYGSPILGDPGAPITLVKFGDYQCHFCNVFFHETRPAILDNHIEAGRVNMIFRDFTIIGQDSVTAAHASHCAADQQSFWKYHDILYENWAGENTGWASTDNLYGFARDLDLDMDMFSECMDGMYHSDLIEISSYDARTLGLTGTPAFFIIGPQGIVQKVVGAQPYEVFERVFDSVEAKVQDDGTG